MAKSVKYSKIVVTLPVAFHVYFPVIIFFSTKQKNVTCTFHCSAGYMLDFLTENHP